MEQATIIGRGTWLDKVASETIEREKKLGRNISLVRVESGLGASGLPHIGSVGDAIRSYGVKLALKNLGYRSELIAYSDDFDGLRKVPAGFPPGLKEYISHPVSTIPDPFGCHATFAEHVGSLLKDSLDRLGIEYRFQSGTEAYASGILNDQIRKILSQSQVIGKKINELVGQSKYESSLPYTPVCSNCGRIYVTQAKSYNSENDSVHYVCEGTKLGEKFVEGCGNEGDMKISEGKGKLMWKVEFAARWAAFDIRFEAYGKELTDSVRINDWVAENVLGYPPPYHARYELFQDKSGKKLSKSTGNLVTPVEWLDFASPESLRLLMFKRIVGARSVSIDDIPIYMDDFDDLEEYYFSKRKDPNVMKDARLKGLYEYSMLLKQSNAKPVHVPYRLLAQLASVAPEGALEDFVLKRLTTYGMVSGPSDGLSARIMWASRWAKRGGRPEPLPIELSDAAKNAIKVFAKSVAVAKSADEIQNAAFEAAKGAGMKAGEFFPAVYGILLGSGRGPRLGPFIMDSGTKKVGETLLEAVKGR